MADPDHRLRAVCQTLHVPVDPSGPSSSRKEDPKEEEGVPVLVLGGLTFDERFRKNKKVKFKWGSLTQRPDSFHPILPFWSRLLSYV